MAALTGDRRDVGGDRVEAAKIVEQPAVEAVGRQRRLDGRDVERRRRDSARASDKYSGLQPASACAELAEAEPYNPR